MPGRFEEAVNGPDPCAAPIELGAGDRANLIVDPALPSRLRRTGFGRPPLRPAG